MTERVTAEDEDQYGGAEAPRMEGYGHIHMNGAAKLMSWILGIFALVMTILLSLVLQAVYTLNGDVHELKGEIKGEVAALRAEIEATRIHGKP